VLILFIFFYKGQPAVKTGMMYGYGPSNSTSIANEISKLDALRKDGAITQDEYNKLKNRLID
jgi:uncharacterized membrane protein